MLLTEAIGIESRSNEFPELEPFKMSGEELIEYLPYIYHPKMDSENEQSYHQVKTRRFVLDNKHKCQITFRYLLPPFCFGSSAGSSKYRVEETAELLKAEDAKSNALELFFQFRQLYRWPKRPGYWSQTTFLRVVGEFGLRNPGASL